VFQLFAGGEKSKICAITAKFSDLGYASKGLRTPVLPRLGLWV
jgi:hypothetical protein